MGIQQTGVPRHARRAAADCAVDELRTARPSTARHADKVSKLAGAIADRLNLFGIARERVVLAARLHDVGKARIPATVLNKPGPLSRLEWELMFQHTLVGEQMLEPMGPMADVPALVRHSHERWDGLGYPDGLKGEQIPLASRIVTCADAYDAICSDRPYSRGRSPAEALAEIRRCAGTQFDPRVVEALAQVVRRRLYARRRSRVRGRSLALAAIMGAFMAPVVGAAVTTGSGPLGFVGGSTTNSGSGSDAKSDSGPTGGDAGASADESGGKNETAGGDSDKKGDDRDHNGSKDEGDDGSSEPEQVTSAPPISSAPGGSGSSSGHGNGHSGGGSSGGGHDKGGSSGHGNGGGSSGKGKGGSSGRGNGGSGGGNGGGSAGKSNGKG